MNIPSNVYNNSYNQREILDVYLNMYNTTIRQIDQLYDYLNEIKHSIDTIVGISENNVSTQDGPSIRNNNNTNNMNSSSEPNSLNENMNEYNNSFNSTNLLVDNINDIIHLLTSSPPSSLISETIRNSTRIIPYRDIENPINDRCPISHEIFSPEENVLQIIYCGHIFNQQEINTWFQRNIHCPVCRYNIGNYRQASNTPLENQLPGNTLLNNSSTQLNRFNMRYDISGNFILFETY
jgi:hypothetical protein